MLCRTPDGKVLHLHDTLPGRSKLASWHPMKWPTHYEIEMLLKGELPQTQTAEYYYKYCPAEQPAWKAQDAR
jgi:hypothetical protein